MLERVLHHLSEDNSRQISFDRVFADSHQFACVIDSDGQFAYVNAAMQGHLGYAHDAIIGHPATDLIHPDDHDRYKQHFTSRSASPYNGGAPIPAITLRFETHRGDPVSISWTIISSDAHGNMYVIGLPPEDAHSQQVADLESAAAEHAQALSIANMRLGQQFEEHQAMAHMQKRLIAILEATSDIVGISDRHNQLVYLNRAAREAMQVPLGQPVSTLKADQFLSPNNSPDVLQNMGEALHSKGIWQGDLTLRTFDGKRDFGVSQVVLVHQEGDETFVSMVARDITKRITTEIKLRDALQTEREISELKSRLTTNISHEFRTPLASIQLSTDIIKRYEDRITSERRMQHIDRIQEQVAHLTSIIDTVLHIDHIQTIGRRIQPEMIHTHRFVGEIIQEMGLLSHDTHTFIIDFENEACVMLADPNLLRQMISNLVDNAIKFTPEGGEIRLSMALQGEECVLRLQDNGIGIPESDQPYIFHTFYRGSNAVNVPGMGLGMVLIKQAVEAHNGQITFESVPNERTIFTVRLPVTQRSED